jgi:hypothetical protein
LSERHLSCFYAGFGLGNTAGVEQFWIAGLDHREECFAGLDFVAGIEIDA